MRVTIDNKIADNSTKPVQQLLKSCFKKASDINSESAAQSSISSDSCLSVHDTKAANSTKMKKKSLKTGILGKLGERVSLARA